MNFNIIFATIVSLSLISGGTAVSLSAQPGDLNPEQKAIVTTCTDTWKLCLGAIVGLIGGRNLPSGTNPEDDNTDPE